jgi:hypothetical protein
MGMDMAAKQIFLPTAEMEPAAAGARPKPKAGSFVIVVVGQQ